MTPSPCVVVGCGRPRKNFSRLCEPCRTEWQSSPENARGHAQDVLTAPTQRFQAVLDTAFADFCRRISAERLNGAKP